LVGNILNPYYKISTSPFEIITLICLYGQTTRSILILMPMTDENRIGLNSYLCKHLGGLTSCVGIEDT